MKYFIDTEFIEGFHKPLFGKRRHFIDLISIGIVAEDGREYYAISKEFNPNDADEWVKENVLNSIVADKIITGNSVQRDMIARLGNDIKAVQRIYGKANNQIVKEIYEFIVPYAIANEWSDVGSISEGAEAYLLANPPEFYGYYADYDWVLFCSLFGRMIDLPKEFPMYCRDLKQMLDEKVMVFCREEIKSTSFESALDRIKIHKDYPMQENEHNALADANWNRKFYSFLNGLK